MSHGTVKGLYRYPVKSMAGETLDRITTGPAGIPGDRAWAVRDETRGGIRGAKRFAELMQCTAAYREEPAQVGSSPAEITLPDGHRIMTTDQEISQRLSHLVNSPVTVWPLLPADALEHYRRGAPVLEDMEAELRRIFARLPDESLPDLTVFPSELMEYESPVGTYFDAFPMLVMTQRSLDSMARVAPDQAWDVRRFRPNILIEIDDDDDFPEFAWEGRRARIGSLELQFEVACPRCVMTTHGFADLPKDPRIMREMVTHSAGKLGIYASVSVPGSAGTGDTLELLD